MSDEFAHETHLIKNRDGSVSLDAYAGKSREELKAHCRKLSRAVGNWQMIAMVLSEHGRDGLSEDDRSKLDTLIEAYRD